MKIEVKQDYKTNAGHRAIVVKDNGDGKFAVWHDTLSPILKFHNAKGFSLDGSSSFDLIEEWKEPLTAEFYVNMYEGGGCGDNHSDRVEADAAAESHGGKRIACQKFTIKEGTWDE